MVSPYSCSVWLRSSGLSLHFWSLKEPVVFVIPPLSFIPTPSLFLSSHLPLFAFNRTHRHARAHTHRCSERKRSKERERDAYTKHPPSLSPLAEAHPTTGMRLEERLFTLSCSLDQLLIFAYNFNFQWHRVNLQCNFTIHATVTLSKFRYKLHCLVLLMLCISWYFLRQRWLLTESGMELIKAPTSSCQADRERFA